MSLDWLKHAFAIEPEAAFVPTAAQQALVDRLCRAVVDRELVTPALLFLETVRPLNFVTSQTLQFFAPLLSGLADPGAVAELTAFLEHRGSIDCLCRKIEELDRVRGKGR